MRYRGVNLDCGYRIDLLVNKMVIIELKAVDRLEPHDVVEPIHEAQLLSYLKLSGCNVGLLINFNVKILRNGIRRMIHGIDLVADVKV